MAEPQYRLDYLSQWSTKGGGTLSFHILTDCNNFRHHIANDPKIPWSLNLSLLPTPLSPKPSLLSVSSSSSLCSQNPVLLKCVKICHMLLYYTKKKGKKRWLLRWVMPTHSKLKYACFKVSSKVSVLGVRQTTWLYKMKQPKKRPCML